jgi:hypothetical protein
MKVVQTYGCTAASFTVDGVEVNDLTDEEKQKFEDVLFANLREALRDHSLTHERLVECLQYDDYETSEPCDQCGDSVSTTTWNLNT